MGNNFVKVLLTIAMANELDALFEELNRSLPVNDTERSRTLVIQPWHKYNEWMAEDQRISLEDFLRRIIQMRKETHKRAGDIDNAN